MCRSPPGLNSGSQDAGWWGRRSKKKKRPEQVRSVRSRGRQNPSFSKILEEGEEQASRARPRAFTDRAPRSWAPRRGGAGGVTGAGPRARASRREGVTQREAARGGGRGGRVLEVELRAGTGSFAAIFCPTKQPIGDGSQPGLHWRFVSRFGQ